MEIQALPINIFEIHALGLPIRQIELFLTVKNPTSIDICILDSWVKVDALNGIRLAEGKIFYFQHAIVESAIIPSGKECQGVIVIELPSIVLNYIEDRRAGGDVELRITSRILVSEIKKIKENTVLGLPRQTQFDNHQLGYVKYQIPQSEWIKLLKSMMWSEMELLEVPSHDIIFNPKLNRALKCLEDAQDCYRRGLWDEAMVNCRKVFEAAVKNVSGKDDMGQSIDVIKASTESGEKADKLNEIAKSLADYLSLARHEKLPHVPIAAVDAELAIRFTGAIIAYMSHGTESGIENQ